MAETLPAVAIIGGAPLAHTNGLFQALAVNALNALAGSVGEPGGVFFTPPARVEPPPATQDSVASVAAAVLQAPRSPVQVLLVDEANPVFASPPAWRVREALEKIPFIASFGSFIDETSILADLILPDHSFLESWVDHIPESGGFGPVVSVAPPAMRPLHQTRAMTDVLFDASRKLAKPLSPPLPWNSYQEMLKASVEANDPSRDAWKNAQQSGAVALPPAGPPPPWPGPAARTGSSVAYSEPQFDGDGAEFPFYFLPFQSQAFLDGSFAHLPWLQELPDVLT